MYFLFLAVGLLLMSTGEIPVIENTTHPMVFKNGFAYTIGRNSDDENVMVRWRPSLRDQK